VWGGHFLCEKKGTEKNTTNRDKKIQVPPGRNKKGGMGKSFSKRGPAGPFATKGISQEKKKKATPVKDKRGPHDKRRGKTKTYQKRGSTVQVVKPLEKTAMDKRPRRFGKKRTKRGEPSLGGAPVDWGERRDVFGIHLTLCEKRNQNQQKEYELPKANMLKKKTGGTSRFIARKKTQGKVPQPLPSVFLKKAERRRKERNFFVNRATGRGE